MAIFDKLKGVNQRVRNLPPEPDADDVPTEAAPMAKGMTCPNCGCGISLQAVADPSAEPPEPEPVAAPPPPAGAPAGSAY